MYLIPQTPITAALVTANNAANAAAWNSGTTYDADDEVAGSDSRTYRSVQGSNTNHDPTTDDGTWWADAGPLNKVAFYDEKVTTQTTRADSLTVELRLSKLCSGLALFNVSGSSVTVEVDISASTEYSHTVYLVDSLDVSNFWQYCFTEPTFRTVAIFPNVPIFSDATLRIIVTATGSTAGLGMIVVGLVKQIGETGAGSGPTLTDYSVVTFDSFGDYTRVVRDYTKGATYNIWLDPRDTDRVFRDLATMRGQIVAAFPAEDMEEYGMTVVGFLSSEIDFSLSHRGKVPATIEISGIS